MSNESSGARRAPAPWGERRKIFCLLTMFNYKCGVLLSPVYSAARVAPDVRRGIRAPGNPPPHVGGYTIIDSSAPAGRKRIQDRSRVARRMDLFVGRERSANLFRDLRTADWFETAAT